MNTTTQQTTVNCKHCTNTNLVLNDNFEAHCKFCGNWSDYSELKPTPVKQGDNITIIGRPDVKRKKDF